MVSDCAALRLEAVDSPALHKGHLFTTLMEKLRAAAPPNFIWLDTALEVIKSTKYPWHLPEVLDKISEEISEGISE